MQLKKKYKTYKLFQPLFLIYYISKLKFNYITSSRYSWVHTHHRIMVFRGKSGINFDYKNQGKLRRQCKKLSKPGKAFKKTGYSQKLRSIAAI